MIWFWPELTINHQQSTINNQQSTINHQPSTINDDKLPIAQVFSSRQNLSTDILVGNAASGDLDHLKMITYLVRLV